ncbi:MAG TPA: hypothetical protein PKC97_15685 [Burkholderiaceae bacterium]|nr:hypothetical protein [Burkholderiaceae bacterium]
MTIDFDRQTGDLLEHLLGLPGRHALALAGGAQHVGEFRFPQCRRSGAIVEQLSSDGGRTGRGLIPEVPARDDGVAGDEWHRQSRSASTA